MAKKPSVTIIGAGFGGLALASFLQAKGWQVTVIDRSDQPGGLAAGYQQPDWEWPLEYFYHHLFGDKTFRRWLAKIAPEVPVDYRAAKTGLLLDGRLVPLNSVADWWHLPGFSLLAKLHFAAGTALFRTLPSQWWARARVGQLPFWLGKTASQKIWQPLLAAKFGDQWPEVSLAWLAARIRQRPRRLGYPRGGFAHLAKVISQKLARQGVEFIWRQKVTRLQPQANGWQIFAGRRRFFAPRLVLALPLPVASQLLARHLPARTARLYQQWPTRAALTLVLRLRRPFLPQNYYWLNILNPLFPFVVVVEQTNFVSPEHYHQEHLVYAGGYYREDDPLLRQRPTSIMKKFAPWLRKLRLDFEDDLLGYDVFRAPYAQPVWTPTNYHQRPQLTTGLPRLYWLSQHHIFPQDRGLNQTVVLAKRLARLLEKEKKNSIISS